GGSGGGVPNNGGPAVSSSAREAVIESIRSFAETIDLRDLSSAQQALVDRIQSMPEFQTAEATPGGVSALFRDGVAYHVFLNRAAKPGENFGEDSGRAQPGRGVEVPRDSINAVMINAMGDAFRDESGVLAPAVASRGYTVARRSGDIENMRNFGRPALFYISAHGDRTKVPVIAGGNFAKDSNGKILMEKAFALSTSTPWNKAMEDKYQYEILLGRVGAGTMLESIVNDRGVFADKLLITTRWVKVHWRFAPNSLIWISACSSNSAISQDFVNACEDGAEQAGLYVGWSDWADDDHAVLVSKFVIDRLLGANLLSPRETPNQRPFDFVQVYADLRARGLHARPTKNPATGLAFANRTTEVVFTQGSKSQFGLLAPTLKTVLVDEYAGTAILLGTFGTPPESERAVLIGGIEAKTKSWAADRIVCELPKSGTGSAGDVVVFVRAHKSNTRRITRWRLNLRYKWFGELAPLVVSGEFGLDFRADVGDYRSKPAEAPTKPVRTAIAATGAKGTIVGSGTAQDADCTVSWSGSAQLETPGTVPNPTNIVGAIMEIDVKTNRGLLGLAFGSLDPQWFTWKIECPDAPTTSFKFPVAAIAQGEPHDFTDPTESGKPALPYLNFPLTLGKDFAISAGAYEEPSPQRLRWEWDASIPDFPPAADAARSVSNPRGNQSDR
ncbi:MAG: hypothetical protein ACKO5K_08580, partial [Armatimonadota bacterium]